MIIYIYTQYTYVCGTFLFSLRKEERKKGRKEERKEGLKISRVQLIKQYLIEGNYAHSLEEKRWSSLVGISYVQL